MTKLNIVTKTETVESLKKLATSGRMRKTFNSYAEAKAAFDKAAESVAAAGLPAHAFPEESFENARASLAFVGSRERNNKGKMETGLKAFVLFPIPTADAFIETAGDWIAKIVEKEAAHVAFRDLRNADTKEEMESAFGAMPGSVDAYVASYDRGGVDTDTFDLVWPEIRKALKANMPALLAALPGTKADVIKGIRSAAFAQEAYPELEARSIFTGLAGFVINGAQSWKDNEGAADPQDVSAIQGWLEERDTFVYPTKQEKETDYAILDKLGLDQIFSGGALPASEESGDSTGNDETQQEGEGAQA